MFILIYFIVVALSQFAANKLLGISDENEDSYSYGKRDSVILALLFLAGILLQILVPRVSFLNSIYWWTCLAYLFAALVIMLVFMTVKKTKIEKQREEIQQVYEILQKMVDRKNEGLDFNNVPFTLGYKYGNINKIDVVVEPTSFDEKILSVILQQLNAFLPTFTWGYELHLEERYMTFVGNDKPPEMARWPGSWLHHFRFMPIGISGKGEVAWQPDSVPKSKMSHSQYLDSHGNPIPVDRSLPTQPQGLVCGAPLGLDTVVPTTKGYKAIETIEVGDEVFDINNKPVKVLGKSEINYNPEKVYKLEFVAYSPRKDLIIVISDMIHRFPKVVGYQQWYMATAKELSIGDYVFANNDSYYGLYKKEEIEQQPVQCISVDSNEHLFLITDKSHIHEEWKGGNSYPYEAVYTRNTGGGKAIWIEQEIE